MVSGKAQYTKEKSSTWEAVEAYLSNKKRKEIF